MWGQTGRTCTNRPERANGPSTEMGVRQQLSDLGLELAEEKRHRSRRSFGGCLAVLIALAVLVVGGYLAYSYGMTAIKDRLSGPEDYSGAGSGRVLVEVKDGDAASD